MAELADRVLLSRSGLTRLVDRLERRGYVRREPSPDDARGTYTVLCRPGCVGCAPRSTSTWPASNGTGSRTSTTTSCGRSATLLGRIGVARRVSAPTRRSVVRNCVGVGVAVGTYGVAFGAAAVAAGLSAVQTCLLSLLAFTGGTQFAVVGVIAGGGAIAAALGSGLLLGSRNALYAMRMAPLLGVRGVRRLLAAHGTIDETTAMAIGQDDRNWPAPRSGGLRRGVRDVEPRHPARARPAPPRSVTRTLRPRRGRSDRLPRSARPALAAGRGGAAGRAGRCRDRGGADPADPARRAGARRVRRAAAGRSGERR